MGSSHIDRKFGRGAEVNTFRELRPLKQYTLAVVGAIAFLPTVANAQEYRELGAHEHGVGELNIAIEGGRISMELKAPGADIVGFEHAASAAADREAVDTAMAVLERPLELFVMPEAAGCTVVEAHAALEADERAHEEEHDHEEDAEEDHEGHDHDDHDHDAHDAEHEDHAEGGHTEFYAEYALDCVSPSDLSQIGFAYFDMFPNAREIELQLLTDKGAQAFEIERDNPVLDLAGQL